jgi:Coenzyme PQQ synthesis protein D (PqqD)
LGEELKMSGHINGARLKVNAPHVIHEAIEGEVIVIDLTTGSYYSLRGSAADVWQLISRYPGLTSAILVDSLAASYGKPREEMDEAVASFLGELLEERLLARVEGTDLHLVPAELEHDVPGRPFEPPLLDKYTDMQDLVLIDPVHEVDERGWPHLPEADAPRASSA